MPPTKTKKKTATRIKSPRYTHPAEVYAHQVATGKIAACKYIVLACKKYFSDRKKYANGKGPFVFKQNVAQAYIEFIQMLALTKGEWAGTPFLLQPWQQFIVWNTFGWLTQAGHRRYTEVTINVPKKNGKTELAAAIALAAALLDQEFGGQVYMAATAREQASLCFHTAKDMVMLTPEVQAHFRPLANAIALDELNTTIKAVSSEASTAEGKGASVVIFDEEHEQKDTQLRDNLRSGMAARSQPLFVSISTAGTDRHKPYYKHLQKCKAILEGRMHDDRHFIMLYTVDKKDEKNWHKPEVWAKANPNYGISLRPEFMQQQYTDALNEPSKQPNFKTKHLDIWTDTHTTWIAHETWMKGQRDITLEQFVGRICYHGLDIASVDDFCAHAMLFPPTQSDKNFTVFVEYYIPDEMFTRRSLAAQRMFSNWAATGQLNLCPGNTIDFDILAQKIIERNKMFDSKIIAYDPQYQAAAIYTTLIRDGIANLGSYPQNIMSMTAPTKEFHKLILEGNLHHNGNEVTGWMLGNVHIYRDANDNQKVHKGKSADKVDGIVATLNALGAYLAESQKQLQAKSVYETRGILSI